MNAKEDTSKNTTKLSSYFLSIFASWLVALFPCFFLIYKNYRLLGHDDLWLAIGFVSIHWLILLLVNMAIFRNGHKASLATIIAVLPLSTFHIWFSFIQNHMPGFFYWHGIILFWIIYGAICFLVFFKIPKDDVFKLNIIFGSVFLLLFLWNFFPTAIRYFKEKEKKEGPKTSVVNQGIASDLKPEKLPNIYLFIFDEYSGSEASTRFYGFDNKKFFARLEDLGFNISNTSRNYVALTKVEIPNLLNLEVDGYEYTEAEKDALMQDPVLFNLLKALGYDLGIINDQNMISTPASFFKYRFESQGAFQVDESLLTVLIDKSVYYPLRSVTKGKRLQEIHEMFDFASRISKAQESNLFMLGYFMFPHNPFVVDEYGNDLNVSEGRNWNDPEIYLGQLKYANVLILKLVEEIQANDPESCIILMSDHASRRLFRQQLNAEIEIEDYDLELYYARNILNAVYLSGKKLDIEGLSGINTVRTILDNLFDLNLGLIGEAD